MKSHLLPRNLCFLIAFFIGLGTSFCAVNSLELNSKTADNKEVIDATLDSYYFNSLLLSKDVNDIKTKAITTNINMVLNSGEKAEINRNEENSYKSIENLAAKQVASVETTKLELAEAQTLFNQGLFYGFALMVIVLNLVCFFLFDEKIFLFYSLALASVTTSLMHSDGVFQIIGFYAIENAEAMLSTLLLAATIFSALFASKYLTLEEFFPKMKYVAAVLLTLSFMTSFTAWFAETSLLTGISNSISIGLMTAYFAIGVSLFSKKNYAKFYVIAYCIPLLFALDFFVFNKLGIGFLFTKSFHLKAATVVEMLIITYAIMYRMRAIKEEHLMRQTEMRIFLKRQEVINRTNTQKLMQDIYLENLIMQYDLDGFEIKLLQYISEGKDNAKIARKLKTTELEIEAYTKELYDKLEIGEHIQEDYRMVENQPDYIYN